MIKDKRKTRGRRRRCRGGARNRVSLSLSPARLENHRGVARHQEFIFSPFFPNQNAEKHQFSRIDGSIERRERVGMLRSVKQGRSQFGELAKRKHTRTLCRRRSSHVASFRALHTTVAELSIPNRSPPMTMISSCVYFWSNGLGPEKGTVCSQARRHSRGGTKKKKANRACRRASEKRRQEEAFTRPTIREANQSSSCKQIAQLPRPSVPL